MTGLASQELEIIERARLYEVGMMAGEIGSLTPDQLSSHNRVVRLELAGQGSAKIRERFEREDPVALELRRLAGIDKAVVVEFRQAPPRAQVLDDRETDQYLKELQSERVITEILDSSHNRKSSTSWSREVEGLYRKLMHAKVREEQQQPGVSATKSKFSRWGFPAIGLYNEGALHHLLDDIIRTIMLTPGTVINRDQVVEVISPLGIGLRFKKATLESGPIFIGFIDSSYYVKLK